jgi:hypothetical protein
MSTVAELSVISRLGAGLYPRGSGKVGHAKSRRSTMDSIYLTWDNITYLLVTQFHHCKNK